MIRPSTGKFRLLCVFSRILGQRTLSRRLEESIGRMGDVEPVYLYLDEDDLKSYSAPGGLRFGDTFAAAYSVRKKFQSTISGSFDGILFLSHELTIPFLGMMKRYPSIVVLDATPVLAASLIHQELGGGRKSFRAQVSQLVWRAIYREVFRSVKLFLPTSEWCRSSLAKDYAVDENRMKVLYFSLDLTVWAPCRKPVEQTPTLLFVGNDFRRKGGEFLLELYQRRLIGKCRLCIVSNDSYLANRELGEGVTVKRGLKPGDAGALIRIYQGSDLFVFPSMRDMFPLVLCEAAATGLPIIARDVGGGARETIIDGYNGRILPYDSNLDMWEKAIGQFLEVPETIFLFGRNSRKRAETLFSPERFNQIIAESIEAHLIGSVGAS